ncbi:winged helix-turn-helix transcriptional regulator [Nocardioides aurantiacus]|uniref:HxlR family transcriptional regulator n=1 Tax=Nocardioides aurantiacus TaxID=86796 RepID=A0A3N2CP02_9ACTN|nr:helix-turn-helix domain-containing protein [Nocardioides aurantiacus]ROR89257.1 HxlR family transcriptional regulator [Nocardioides aurantiacus]
MTTVPLAQLPGRPCPVAATLELVGERWSLLVVREVALGAHRFGDIVTGTGAPRDRVAARLRSLTGAGVLERRQYQSGPDRFDYHLTGSGRDLLPVLTALLVWGRDHAVSPDDPDRDRHRETLRLLRDRSAIPDPTPEEPR